MGKKAVVISTSLRGGSNSEMLAESFAKGAEEAGNSVTLISLKDKKLVSVSDVFPVRKKALASLKMMHLKLNRKF